MDNVTPTSCETYKCSHCGIKKPISEFRKYYRSDGHYTWCLSCDALAQRWRYLLRASEANNINDAQKAELAKIEEVYAARKAAGLKVPKRPTRRANNTSKLESLDAELQRLSELSSEE